MAAAKAVSAAATATVTAATSTVDAAAAAAAEAATIAAALALMPVVTLAPSDGSMPTSPDPERPFGLVSNDEAQSVLWLTQKQFLLLDYMVDILGEDAHAGVVPAPEVSASTFTLMNRFLAAFVVNPKLCPDNVKGKFAIIRPLIKLGNLKLNGVAPIFCALAEDPALMTVDEQGACKNWPLIVSVYLAAGFLSCTPMMNFYAAVLAAHQSAMSLAKKTMQMRVLAEKKLGRPLTDDDIRAACAAHPEAAEEPDVLAAWEEARDEAAAAEAKKAASGGGAS